MPDLEDQPTTIPLGGIIGIAVVGAALVIVIIVILYLLCTRHMLKKNKEDASDRKKEVIYAEVGNSEGQTSSNDPSSHYAKVEFKKSDNFKQHKVKDSKSKKKEPCPVYAEIQSIPQTMAHPDSPEPRYANINIQSSVWYS